MFTFLLNWNHLTKTYCLYRGSQLTLFQRFKQGTIVEWNDTRVNSGPGYLYKGYEPSRERVYTDNVSVNDL